ncbi:ABC transporter permease [Vibrio alginolyticus]|uniref:ABC transporter permease n=1 Tax=Vibrio alginolyticus TaxID=663 RepID=UPI001BD6A31E|nr:ABC transporter permease [Vibrio alginolyticus]EGQ8042411.1 ABC transporter permease [Vibrio alginolyticus]MBS9829166.1 ABC transporter permease [Vibrio alginolyticus]MBS9857551.1 ABC transporter permease [Vibrio alginolyticus]MBT0058875.1 ABC transporter permease [Vibrio alginolyticus]MCQ9090093.1 ABC transporter permease [Vibrio alginolyticus]
MTLWQLIKAELKAVLTNPVVTLTVFGGVVFYSFLYPLPYAQQTPREQPIAIVNLDGSQTSLKLERMVDATPQVNIVTRLHTIADAKQAFLQREITGFLVIPEHFYKDLMLGKSPTLAYAADASYFLVYGTVVEGLAQAGGTLGAQVKVSKMVIDGVPMSMASHNYSAIKLNMKPTFNPTMGYIEYVVPAVFVLILQQTLIMAVGLQTGTQRHGRGYWSQVSTGSLLLVRTLVFVAIYYLLGAYYFGFSFERLNVNHIANAGELLAMLFPFFLGCCGLGFWLGYLLPRRELVTLVVLVSSMPLIFLAGFIWPIEAIPTPLLWIADLSPSTWAIKAFLALNQMGATWQQVAPHWTALWALTVLWGNVAYWIAKRSNKPVVTESLG